jgi:hypothetical protein
MHAMPTDHQRARARHAALAASRRADLSRALDAEAEVETVPPAGTTPRPPAPPRCDRSADAGSTHVWREGAQVGDWCLCGKRRRFTPF